MLSLGVSISQLQDIAYFRAQQLPSLNMLTRYLEVTANQDYLVKRIKGGDCVDQLFNTVSRPLPGGLSQHVPVEQWRVLERQKMGPRFTL